MITRFGALPGSPVGEAGCATVQPTQELILKTLCASANPIAPIPVIIAVAIGCSAGPAPTNPGGSPEPASEPVAASASAAAAEPRAVRAALEGFALEGAVAEAYFSGDVLTMVRIDRLGETFRSSIDIVYAGEKLAYVREEWVKFAGMIADDAPVMSADTYIIVFSGETMVSWIHSTVKDGKYSAEDSTKSAKAGQMAQSQLARAQAFRNALTGSGCPDQSYTCQTWTSDNERCVALACDSN